MKKNFNLAVIILAIICFYTPSEAFGADEFVIPSSDTEKISVPDIASLDLKTIEIAKNEIYARRGLIFQFPEVNDYFKKKSWYKPDKNFKKDGLNYFEASNVRLLEGILRNPALLKQAKRVESEDVKLPPAKSADVAVVPEKITANETDKILQNLIKSLESKDASPTSEELKARVQAAGVTKPKPAAANTKGDTIVATARSMIGKPYRMGGTSPQTGFDCSGFVLWVYSQHGIKIARASTGQRHDGIKISAKDMKPGDIVVVKNRRGRDSPNGYHTGIYVGGGAMIHAPGRGRRVLQIKLTHMNVVEGRRVTK